MSTDQGASADADRAATLSEPSQSSVVSGVAGIPCAFTLSDVLSWARTKPADKRYGYEDPQNCIMAQFGRDTARACLIGIMNLGYAVGRDIELAAARGRTVADFIAELERRVEPSPLKRLWHRITGFDAAARVVVRVRKEPTYFTALTAWTVSTAYTGGTASTWITTQVSA